jgi:hypothetical protein
MVVRYADASYYDDEKYETWFYVFEVCAWLLFLFGIVAIISYTYRKRMVCVEFSLRHQGGVQILRNQCRY